MNLAKAHRTIFTDNRRTAAGANKAVVPCRSAILQWGLRVTGTPGLAGQLFYTLNNVKFIRFKLDISIRKFLLKPLQEMINNNEINLLAATITPDPHMSDIVKAERAAKHPGVKNYLNIIILNTELLEKKRIVFHRIQKQIPMKKTFFLLASLIICVLSRAQVAPAEFEDKSYLKGDVNARKTRPTGIAEIRTATGLVSELGSIADFSSVAADARVLTIQNKQLQSLDHSVLRLRQLQVLDVSHNDLTDIDNSVFSSLPELKKVYVNNNRIPDTRVDEWRQLFPGIRFFTDKDIYTLETP